MLEASPDYILAIDAERRVVYVNRTDGLREKEDVLGATVETFVPPDSREEALAVVRRALEDREAGGWEARTEETEERFYVTRVVPLLDLEVARALVIVQDVTTEHRARHALRFSEERIQLAMTKGQIGFWELDLTTMDGSLSASLQASLGLGDRPVTPRDMVERTHPDDRVAATKLLSLLVDDETPPTTFEREYRLLAGDGTYRHFIDRAVRTTGGRGQPIYCGTMVDVTELRTIEERERELRSQLEQAQRLESVGLLAGGIAHDFNNLLTVIIGGLDLVRRGTHVGRDVTEEIDQVFGAAERAAELTGQLLAFGRRNALQLEVIDLRAVARHVVEMAERLLPETIALTTETSPRPAWVRADRQQLEQALLNLLINARDAMPDGGTIDVGVRRGENASITVTDTGTGISASAKERIFDPFFTTKPLGEGSGLGLAMVHGIVQQHGGRIDVDTEEGRGTAMTLHFPPVEKETSEEAPPRDASPRARILVAEDERHVRELVARMLRSGGFEVVTTAHGREALEVFRRDRDFDLLLLDVVMPELDGWQTYEAIRKLDPDVRVLFSTGYSNDALPTDAGVPLLRKPYRMEGLIRAVVETLGTATA